MVDLLLASILYLIMEMCGVGDEYKVQIVQAVC